MDSKTDALLGIQRFFRDSLLKNGWKELNMNLTGTTLALNSYVIRIENQGHGEIDWIGFKYDEPSENLKHCDLLVGYQGPAPVPLAVFRVSGTPAACKVIVRTASLNEGEIYSGKIEGALDKLIPMTCSEIERYGSHSGPRA